MVLRLILCICFLWSCQLMAQKEANIWYFGNYAGLDFNSGSPVPLTDGQLKTSEGCATIADKNGSLLFYTDGVTVWNRNHTIMLNGTGLHGHSSSTHSAIIVPRPNFPNIYYIFTVDKEGDSNGLQYSEVDMTLDGGLGGLTLNKNILLHTPSTEKIAAVKNAVDNSYWVVAHKWDSDEFVSYKVTSLGVNSVPVVSAIGTYVSSVFTPYYSTERSHGAMKISPNGKKLALAITGIGFELYDFNNLTGKISNYQVLSNTAEVVYGVEFSSNSQFLYISADEGIFSYRIYDIMLNDILEPKGFSYHSNIYPLSLQLASDGKIYIAIEAIEGGDFLGVIPTPNDGTIGARYNVVSLNGRSSESGLPTFISSYFRLDEIIVVNTCYEDMTKFLLNDTVESVIWDFGDPVSGVNNTSTDFEPTHVFSNPGTYEVSVTLTVGTKTATEKVIVTIQELPNINDQVDLKQCDDDLDGFSAFNLEEVIPKITLNATNETITFFETQADAESNTNQILNTTNYANKTVSADTVWARVENNNGCYKASQVNLIVTTTQIPNKFKRDFYACDDDLDGDTSNGISVFDFSSVNSEIQAMFPMAQQLTITYYRNEADALAEQNQIMDISNYRNIGYPNSQQIYVRVDSEEDNDCLGLGTHINLYVEPLPIANPVTIVSQCYDGQDGIFPFDVSTVETDVLGGQSLTSVTVSYFDENNTILPSPLPNPFLTQSQIIRARVENNKVPDGSCYAETTIAFIVGKQPIANSVPNQIVCDEGVDDTDGFYDFDTSLIESTILNGQIGMEVHYYEASGNELPSPLPNPFLSSSQTISVEVINPINRSCVANTEIVFIVNSLPEFSIETPQFVCSSDPTSTVVLDPQETNINEVFDYEWVQEDGTILSHASTLKVSTPGTYSITLTKTDGTGCSRTRDIFVNASELATITQNDIKVVDNSDNNTITISPTSLGQGNYEFVLDNEFGNYQSDPFFEYVRAGMHTLFIRDKKGCGTSSIDISVIGFPKFFTPNGDGIHDYWRMEGVDGQFQSKSDIYIYDRYGKLLKQLETTSNGWDGTFNGSMLPTGDYWFSVVLEDGRELKGHFALKR